MWNVDQMLDEMPAALFAEWQAFSELEPFGSEVDGLRAAQMPWVYANSNRGKSSTARPLRDFLIGGEDSSSSPEERQAQRAAWQAAAAVFDASVDAAFKAAAAKSSQGE